MPKSAFVDFKAIKAAITMEQVLQHYGILDKFKRGNDSLSGPCPIHKGHNPTQFRVSISKNIWNCFSECKHGGNVLDFIARMEDVSVHAAAVKATEWFNLDSPSTAVEERPKPQPSAKSVSQTKMAVDDMTPNPTLKFRLDKLQRDHPYLIERGLTLETIIDFGIGYCIKGMMAERIAIPIHNPEGGVVAYAGRWLGEPPEGTPKYKLPPGFKKSLELFNVDRARKEPAEKPLVIVEGFFGCMMLHQHGHRKVVSLMGNNLSPAQEQLLREVLTPDGRVILMLDHDEAGRIGTEEIIPRLSRFAYVKSYCFEKEGMQPEQLTAEQVASLL
jgi:DNA primase